MAKNKISVFTKPLGSTGREPGELFLGEAPQTFDRAQGCNNICNGPGVFRAFHLRLHLLRNQVAWQVHYCRLVNIHEIHRLAISYNSGCLKTLVFGGPGLPLKV